MSEHLKARHEFHKDESELHVETEQLPDIEKFNKDALEKNAENMAVEELNQGAIEKAKASKEIAIEDGLAQPKQEFGAYAEMKGQVYTHTLKRIQRRLSGSERTMSKVMHNKAVEKVSDGLGKTAARPSGILGGGIVSLFGSFVLLYMTKKYGFEYNFFVFFMLMATGFALGLMIELAIYAARKAHR